MDARLQLRLRRYGWDKAAAHYDACWSAQRAHAEEAVGEPGSFDAALCFTTSRRMTRWAPPSSAGPWHVVARGANPRA